MQRIDGVDTCCHPECYNPVAGVFIKGVAQWARALWCGTDGKYFDGVINVTIKNDSEN